MVDVSFSQKITLHEFFRLRLFHVLRIALQASWVILIFLLIGVLLILLRDHDLFKEILLFLDVLFSKKGLDTLIESLDFIFLCSLIVFLFKLGETPFTWKGEFYKELKFSESVNIEVKNERFSIIGQSLFFGLEWNKVHFIEEFKDWFLIYRNKELIAIFSLKNISDKQYQEIRNIFSSIETDELKVKLKN